MGRRAKKERLIIMTTGYDQFMDEVREINSCVNMMFKREQDLSNTLTASFIEMAYMAQNYIELHESVIKNPDKNFEMFANKLSNTVPKKLSYDIIVIGIPGLESFFKSFIILTKVVLDKLVPLYSYRFYDNLKYFHDKGTNLITAIKNNSNVPNKDSFVTLLNNAKHGWIDSLIELRDEYAHKSQLSEYIGFWISNSELYSRKISIISDMNRPSIEISGKLYDALDYVVATRKNIVKFLSKFLTFCDYNKDRAPKAYLECECGHVFAKKLKKGPNKGKLLITASVFEMQVKDISKDYALIICPHCKQKTDTNIAFWKEHGFNFTNKNRQC